MKITITAVKADVGGCGGHIRPDPRMKEAIAKFLETAKGVSIIDFHIQSVGDDIGIIMTHTQGENSEVVHKLAWDAFCKATEIAKSLGLYGAGQDLLKDSFSGTIKGMGPAIAEMEIEERPAETIVCFQADKTEPGAYNLPLYLMFADPMHNSGLMLSPKMSEGFNFEIIDVEKTDADTIISLNAPEDIYDIVTLIRNNHRYIIEKVFSRTTGEIAAVNCTTRLSLIAGKYVGKDDPIMLVRAQSQFPATGEILSPFTIVHYVSGFMRGSHIGPLTPVPINSDISYFDGPPIVSAVAFNVKNGKLTNMVDCFANQFWNGIREKANLKALYIREQGFSGPAMLEDKELEYGGITERLDKLKDRFYTRKKVVKQKP
ncbi:fructose 1,6-bisphosphatase [Candidatus Woesearchaeota archaeon]|nr:fructose-1,6-bisphosphatase [Candidatus Woesearchaeota archaeon]RLE43395.1 MAG: fructose 1,6-bisphosphatase [Candidatus Woesearchaeota archaeon]